MSSTFRCLVCHEGPGDPVYLGCEDYYLGTPFKADYYRCHVCGLLQQHPIPADVSAFYDHYPIHAPKGRLYDLLRWLVMEPVYYRLDRRQPPGRLLDYGCGDGGYLQARRGSGWTLIGYENNPTHAARLAQRLQLPVYSHRAELLPSQRGTLDVVTMHFALEHLTDLDEAFADVRELLRPGGTFYYVVPEASSWEARLFKRRWHGLDPPRHVSFPDPGTARRLAERHGFALTHHAGVAFPNTFAASLPPALVGRFSFPAFALFLPLGILFSRLAPTGSRAYWLEKVPAATSTTSGVTS